VVVLPRRHEVTDAEAGSPFSSDNRLDRRGHRDAVARPQVPLVGLLAVSSRTTEVKPATLLSKAQQLILVRSPPGRRRV